MNAPLVSEDDDQYESGSGGGDKFFCLRKSGGSSAPSLGSRIFGPSALDRLPGGMDIAPVPRRIAAIGKATRPDAAKAPDLIDHHELLTRLTRPPQPIDQFAEISRQVDDAADLGEKGGAHHQRRAGPAR